MGSVNTIFLIGRLGGNPELRYTAAGKAFCKFSLATDRRSGSDQEPTADWHNVVAWERLAETCSKYLTKGKQVAVVGRIRYDTYIDKQGIKKFWTEIRANEVTFLGSKSDGERAGGYGYAAGKPDAVLPGGALRPLVASAQPAGPGPSPHRPPSGLGPNDDLPF